MAKIIFVNDKAKYNLRYRSDLMKQFSKIYSITSLGLFDSAWAFLNTLVKLLLCKNTVLISSNLKSNLVVLMFLWKKKVIIINGLGRYRESKLLRSLIIILVKLQFHNILIFVQNYADYRYFQKYLDHYQ